MNHIMSARRWSCTLLLAGGCTTAQLDQEPELRNAEDTPTSFVTEDGTPARNECRTALVDPRDQTRLRLIRSVGQGTLLHGDYDVPSGKYGVGDSELFRIDCETGQALGIVKN
jgi:hypothetical protein